MLFFLGNLLYILIFNNITTANEILLKNNKNSNLYELNNFPSIEEKPIPVRLKRSKNLLWNFDVDLILKGAIAKVKMEEGSIVEIIEKKQKNIVFNINFVPIKGKESTFTVRELPNGIVALVLFSEKLYADRFRFVAEMQPMEGVTFYFLEESKKSSK